MHNRLKKYGKILVYSDSEQSKMHRRSNVESTKLSVDADAIYGYNKEEMTYGIVSIFWKSEKKLGTQKYGS